MADLVGGLLLFTCVGIVWAVTGHVIWVVLRTLLALVFGGRCPKCNTLYLTDHHHCRESQPTPDWHDDLSAVLRVLQHPIASRKLSSETVSALRTFVSEALKPPPIAPQATSTPAEITDESPVVTIIPQKTSSTQPLVTQSPHPPLQAANPPTPKTTQTPHPLDPDPKPAPEFHPPKAPAQSPFPAPVVIATTMAAEPSQVLDLKPTELPAPSQPQIREPWTTAIVARFMEQANVRWVELISALLVVGCSIGLVISLWHTLSETTRFFPSLVFLLSTVAVHFVGQYTLKKWNLRSTSRGILHIGLMLIPLSVLVGLLLARREAPPSLDIYSGGILLLATSCYSYLSISAARTLSKRHWKMMTAAVMLALFSLVAIDVHSQYGNLGGAFALATTLLPSVLPSFLVATALTVRGLQRRSFPDYTARELAGCVAQVVFATATPLAFYTMQADSASGEALWLSMLLPACGWTAFASILATRLQSIREGAAPAWLAVFSWGLLAISASLLLLAVGQLPRTTTTYCFILTAGGLYLSVIATAHGLSRACFAGLTAMLFGLSMIPLAMEPQSLLEVNWMALPSVLQIAIAGAAACGGAVAIHHAVPRPSRQRAVGWTGYRPNLTLQSVLQQTIASGAILLAVSACLTLLASFHPEQSHWATPALAIAGWPLLIYALFAKRQTTELLADNSLGLMLGFGLALTGVSTVQSILIHDLGISYLDGYKMAARFAISLCVTSLAWSAMSGICTAILGSRRSAATTTAGGAMGLAIPATLLLIASDNSAALFCHWGWLAAAVTLVGCLVLMDRNLARLSVTSICAWMIVVNHIVFGDSLLSDFGLVGYLSIQSLLCLAVVAFVQPWLVSGIELFAARQSLQLKNTPSVAWDVGIVAWSTTIAVCGILGVYFLDTLAQAFGADAANFMASGGQLTPVALLGAFAAILFAQWLLYRERQLGSAFAAISIGGLPVVLGCGCGTVAGPDHLLTVLNWILAGSLIASEALAFVPSLRRPSGAIWSSLFAAKSPPTFSNDKPVLRNLLRCTTMHRTSASLLLVVSSTLGLLHMLNLDDQPSALLRLLPLVPAFTFLAVRWICIHAHPRAGKKPTEIQNAAFVSNSTILMLLFATGTWLSLADLPTSYLVPRLPLAIAVGYTALICMSRSIEWMTNRSKPERSMLRFDQGRSQVFVPATVAWLAMTAMATALVFMLPAVRLPGSHFFASWQLVAGLALYGGAALAQTNAWRRRNNQHGSQQGLGLLGLPLIGLTAAGTLIAAPLCTAALASWLILQSNESVVSQAQWFLPSHVLVLIWLLSALAVTSLLWRDRAKGPGQGNASSASKYLANALLCAVGLYAFVGTLVDPAAWFPSMVLGVLAAAMVVVGTLRGQLMWSHFAAVVAAVAITPLIRSSWSQGSINDGLVHVLWGPIAVSLLSQLLQELAARMGLSLRLTPDKEKPELGASVSATTSILISACFLPLSFAVCIFQPVGLQWTVFAAIQAAATFVAATRCFARGETRRSSAVYVSVIGLSGWIGAAIANINGLGIFESLLIWSTSILSAMSLLGLAIKELFSSPGLAARIFGDTALGLSRVEALAQRITPLHLTIGILSAAPAAIIAMAAPEQSLRLMASALPLVGMTTIVPLLLLQTQITAYRGEQIGEGDLHPKSTTLRYSVACLGSLTFLLSWWVDLPRVIDATWPTLWIYAQRGLLSFTVLMIVMWSAERLFTKHSPWQPIAKRLGILALIAALSTGSVLVALQVFSSWQQAAVEATLASKLLSLLAWVGLGARLAQYAVSSERGTSDDSPKSLGQRKALLYGVEFCLLGFSLSAYTQFPDIFEGLIADWWPVWAFAISFASGCIGEALSRLQRGRDSAALAALESVVSQNGLLLPLLPLFGVWVGSANAIWTQWHVFSGLLLGGAVVYAAHSARLRSIPLALFSSCLLLAAYWTTLHSFEDLQFLNHPQFWLLPPCFVALIASHKLQPRLPNATVAALRYSALIIAYLSSSSEVFFESMGGTLWQALLLLVLALIGVAAGIALRVQSFLYCGATFTFLATLGMVLNAQRAIGGVWPWWAFGIATGVGLIFLLGYFEKNRQSILERINRVQSWKA